MRVRSARSAIAVVLLLVSLTSCLALDSGERLPAGESVRSTGEQYRLVMQGDGNLVEYDAGGTALWSSGTEGNPGAWAVMQDDGNLVVYRNDGGALWDSGTNRNPGASLHLGGPGDLLIDTAAGRPI